MLLHDQANIIYIFLLVFFTKKTAHIKTILHARLVPQLWNPCVAFFHTLNVLIRNVTTYINILHSLTTVSIKHTLRSFFDQIWQTQD